MECAVVGAGPSGLLLALLLARAGRMVTVLEREPRLDPPVGGVVLQPATLGLLSRLGDLSELWAVGIALEGIDETSSAGLLFSGNYADLPGTPFPWALAVPLRAVRQVLLDRLAGEPGVRIQTGAQVVELRQQPAHCEIEVRSGGRSTWVHASFVVGADGKYSTVREAAGLAARMVPFPGRQLIARMARPAGWPARVLSHRAEQPVVVVPSGAGALHLFAAVTGGNGAGLDELARILEHLGSALAPGLRSTGEQVALIRHHTVQVPRWSAGRVVLLGDSAHCLHPYGGQGMNLGMQDAALLCEVLDRALAADAGAGPPAPAHGPAILAEFEAVRRPFVERFQARQRELLRPASAVDPFYPTDFAELALGQPALRPLFRCLPPKTATTPDNS